MQILPVFDENKWPIMIAGPCSAENRDQLLATAEGLQAFDIDLFRAGVWKPRTRPDSFEGVGEDALPWLKEVKQRYGFRITTEVANTNHVEKCLEYGVDVLWIGARTTVNPFSVQEIASALEGVDIPVMIKNPISPDLALWIGAFERFYKSGIKRMAAIHRGFSALDHTKYRNKPQWQIPLELRIHVPGLQIIVDPSHICGDRENLYHIAQKGLDLNYDGIMIETHFDPDKALSDAKQQIKPEDYGHLIRHLILRNQSSQDIDYLSQLSKLRDSIDEIDKDLIHILYERMKISDKIARLKKNNNITIYQRERWQEVIDNAIAEGDRLGLSTNFINNVLRAIHEESINHQDHIMNTDE
jgi:chorismate mutase